MGLHSLCGVAQVLEQDAADPQPLVIDDDDASDVEIVPPADPDPEETEDALAVPGLLQ